MVMNCITKDNTKELNWGLNFNKIFYGKEEELASYKTELLRVEYGLINGNKNWQEVLEKYFFRELMKKNKCFKGKGWNNGHTYFQYYCNINILNYLKDKQTKVDIDIKIIQH